MSFVLPGKTNPLASFGQAFGQRLATDFGQGMERKQEMDRVNKALQMIQDPDFKPLNMAQAVSSLRPDSQKLVMEAYDRSNRQKNLSQALSMINQEGSTKGFYESLSQLPKEDQKIVLDAYQKNQFENVGNTIKPILKEIDPRYPALWDASPIGGKTQIVAKVADYISRGLLDVPEEISNVIKETNDNLNSFNNDAVLANENFDEANVLEENMAQPDLVKDQWPELPSLRGRTAAERVKLEDKRYDVHLPLYQEAQKKLRTYEGELDQLGILEDLTLNGNIRPDIVKALYIDASGNIALPFNLPGGLVATDDEQLYIKIINDFTKNAKDSYGARVTNFDLEQFMRRLPTLANSPGAMRLIIRYLQNVNTVNRLYEKNLVETADHYGLRKGDWNEFERISKDRIKDKVSQIRKDTVNLRNVLKQEEEKYVSNFIKETPPDQVAVVRRGRYARVKKENLEKALNSKWEKLRKSS